MMTGMAHMSELAPQEREGRRTLAAAPAAMAFVTIGAAVHRPPAKPAAYLDDNYRYAGRVAYADRYRREER